jgi:quinol monooxygenase YgiN
MYTSGVWIVKEGREAEFARRWQESADSVALNVPDLKFMLLHDRENPRRFISLGEGWRNSEQIEAARSTPEFQDTMSSIWRVLDSGELATLDLIASVS